MVFFSKEQGDDGGRNSSGIFERFKKGLAKTRDLLNTDLKELFSGGKSVKQLAPDLEEILLKSDLGVKASRRLIQELSRRLKGDADLEAVKDELRGQILSILKPLAKPLLIAENAPRPYVILMLGVNGTGKTTTIGKLAMKFKSQGRSVLVAAADTFRAAAIEQLEQWAERAGAQIVKSTPGGDPAAVCFDAISAAKNRGIDVVIIDTAGRLHTRSNLMEELKKVKRVSEKALQRKIDETILVLDATTGQNAIEQARVFQQELELTGVIMTKLDGTAKGGIIIAIADLFQIPIRLIGIGEEIEDLADFQADEFVNALL
jgi:fused signal recognition particle receptor